MEIVKLLLFVVFVWKYLLECERLSKSISAFRFNPSSGFIIHRHKEWIKVEREMILFSA